MTAPSFTIPGSIRLTVLDEFLGHLIGGATMDRAVRLADADGLTLRKFGRECGFPSRSAMRDARAVLREQMPQAVEPPPAEVVPIKPAQAVEAAKSVHPAYSHDHKLVQHRDGKPPWCDTCDRDANGVDQKHLAGPLAPPAAVEETGDPVPFASVLESGVAAAVRAGRKSGQPRIVAVADRLERAHADLVTLLREHHAKSVNAARIAELEAELARLRGKPAPGSRTAARRAPSTKGKATSPSKAVREWAWSQGLECPTLGPIPKRVQEAYDAAMGGDDA